VRIFEPRAFIGKLQIFFFSMSEACAGRDAVPGGAGVSFVLAGPA
jgi:hypothetical protein